jgi:hypothetical protein
VNEEELQRIERGTPLTWERILLNVVGALFFLTLWAAIVWIAWP